MAFTCTLIIPWYNANMLNMNYECEYDNHSKYLSTMPLHHHCAMLPLLYYLTRFVIIEQGILIWVEYLNICSFNAMFVWDCVLCCFRSTECRAAVNRCWVMQPPACVIFKRTPFPAESVNHLHSSLAFSSRSLRQDNSQTKHIITHTHTHTHTL